MAEASFLLTNRLQLSTAAATNTPLCQAALILEDAAKEKHHQVVGPWSPPLDLSTTLRHSTLLGGVGGRAPAETADGRVVELDETVV